MGYYVNKNQHISRKANFLYAVNSLGPSIIKTQHKNEVDEKWGKCEIHASFFVPRPTWGQNMSF